MSASKEDQLPLYFCSVNYGLVGFGPNPIIGIVIGSVIRGIIASLPSQRVRTITKGEAKTYE
jgi:hypothetical protein